MMPLKCVCWQARVAYRVWSKSDAAARLVQRCYRTKLACALSGSVFADSAARVRMNAAELQKR
eukprot:5285311-Pleurochrysis_carterae.AAC.3